MSQLFSAGKVETKKPLADPNAKQRRRRAATGGHNSTNLTGGQSPLEAAPKSAESAPTGSPSPLRSLGGRRV